MTQQPKKPSSLLMSVLESFVWNHRAGMVKEQLLSMFSDAVDISCVVFSRKDMLGTNVKITIVILWKGRTTCITFDFQGVFAQFQIMETLALLITTS